jgi:hypothetical protein
MSAAKILLIIDRDYDESSNLCGSDRGKCAEFSTRSLELKCTIAEEEWDYILRVWL